MPGVFVIERSRMFRGNDVVRGGARRPRRADVGGKHQYFLVQIRMMDCSNWQQLQALKRQRGVRRCDGEVAARHESPLAWQHVALVLLVALHLRPSGRTDAPGTRTEIRSLALLIIADGGRAAPEHTCAHTNESGD